MLNNKKESVIVKNCPSEHTCDDCTMSFKTVKELNKHKKSHRAKPSCEHCSKVFQNKCNLKEHMKLHWNPQATIVHSVKCGTCDKSFFSKSSIDVAHRHE